MTSSITLATDAQATSVGNRKKSAKNILGNKNKTKNLENYGNI